MSTRHRNAMYCTSTSFVERSLPDSKTQYFSNDMYDSPIHLPSVLETGSLTQAFPPMYGWLIYPYPASIYSLENNKPQIPPPVQDSILRPYPPIRNRKLYLRFHPCHRHALDSIVTQPQFFRPGFPRGQRRLREVAPSSHLASAERERDKTWTGGIPRAPVCWSYNIATLNVPGTLVGRAAVREMMTATLLSARAKCCVLCSVEITESWTGCVLVSTWMASRSTTAMSHVTPT